MNQFISRFGRRFCFIKYFLALSLIFPDSIASKDKLDSFSVGYSERGVSLGLIKTISDFKEVELSINYMRNEDISWMLFDQNNDYPIYLRTKKFRLGFCPQNSGYFHDLTLLENLNTIGEILIENKKIRNEKIDSMISKFELDSVKDVKANYLSGGQKKKLVIALALLSNPKILLLDEPFAALDVMTIKMLQKIIVDLQSEDNISVILCDHQARDLLTCVDLAIVLSNCKIVASGTPSELINNNEAKSAYFGDSFKLG